ncbi:MAG TPA: TolC family protein, partial [Fibrobacteraceae bacterium]|nr:TolC family protein [Fibrobacteraceae bacterium]
LARASADSLEAVRRLDSLRQEFLALSGASYPDALLTDSGNCPTADSSTLTPKSLAAEILETQALALGKSGEAATATRYPSLAIFAGYRYGNPGLNQFETEWMGYGLLGAQLQWNLFDGFERKATQARFAADARTLLAEAARVRLDQEKSLATLQQEIGNIAAQRRSLQVGLDAATAARDAYRDALARGAASADDVRDAELRVDDISTQVELLAIRRSMLELRLAYASGQDIQFDFPKEP